MTLIGIVGFAGSGKGSVSDILRDRWGFSKIAFADSVKDAVSTIFQWPREFLEGDTEASREFRETLDPWWSQKLGYNVTPRSMLQRIGTEAGRKILHEDIWLLNVSRKINLLTKDARIVIPDARFPNEIEFIRKSGGKIVRVIRGEEPSWYEDAILANRSGRIEWMKSLHPDVDISEWAWIGTEFDHVIVNDGDLHDLIPKVVETF
jgi:hypothetical protein